MQIRKHISFSAQLRSLWREGVDGQSFQGIVRFQGTAAGQGSIDGNHGSNHIAMFESSQVSEGTTGLVAMDHDTRGVDLVISQYVFQYLSHEGYFGYLPAGRIQ